MKSATKWLSLTALPGLFFLLCDILSDYRGPLWLGTNSDPSYQYLLNSLLLAHGVPPQHVDHPGTTTQTFGAAFAIAHSHDIDSTTDIILKDPEAMLTRLVSAQLILSTAALWFVGAVSLARLRSAPVALCVQGAPLLLLVSYRAPLHFAPEALLLVLSLVFVALLIAREYAATERERIVTDLVLAATCGAALATKITFAPLCVLPLITQPNLGRSILSAITMILVAAILLLPIWPELPRVLQWFIQLATHRGTYGQGESGFVDWSIYLNNVLHVLTLEPLVALTVTGSLLAGLWVPRIANSSGSTHRKRLLIISGTAQTIGLLLIAKHPHHPHYILPIAVSCTFNFAIALQILIEAKPSRLAFGLFAMTIPAISTALKLTAQASTWRTSSAEQLAMKNEAENVSGLRVEYYRSSSPEFALFFGNSSARHFFGNSLEKNFPGRVFFNIFTHRFETFRHRLPFEIVSQRGLPIYFHGDGNIDKLKLPRGVTLEPFKKNGSARISRMNLNQ